MCASKNRNISKKSKETLIWESGNKCANPGCSNKRTEFHHIKEWAIYKTHDIKEMIAICPACHDAVHHGRLLINDETIYRWKTIKRDSSNRDHIYVEPKNNPLLLLGSMAFATQGIVNIFKLSEYNKLSFRVIDEDIFILNLNITSKNGKEIFRILENDVKYEIQSPVVAERRPGKISVTAPIFEEFIPEWVIMQMVKVNPKIFSNYNFKLIDIEVLKPGLVKVEGFWLQNTKAIYICDKQISFLWEGAKEPKVLTGSGEDTVLYTDPSSLFTMFKFGD